MKSFRKQTQGSNLTRNALQRESCTRQLGFFTLCFVTLDVRRQRWDYWATASADDLFPTIAFSVRFEMVRDHFAQMLAALSFGPADDGTDVWLPARALINIHLWTCPTSAIWSAVICILFEQLY